MHVCVCVHVDLCKGLRIGCEDGTLSIYTCKCECGCELWRQMGTCVGGGYLHVCCEGRWPMHHICVQCKVDGLHVLTSLRLEVLDVHVFNPLVGPQYLTLLLALSI